MAQELIRARADTTLGVGRPPLITQAAARRVAELRARGYSCQEIADVLNDEGLPTPARRAPWSKSHVYRVLSTRYIQELSSQTAPPPPGAA